MSEEDKYGNRVNFGDAVANLNSYVRASEPKRTIQTERGELEVYGDPEKGVVTYFDSRGSLVYTSRKDIIDVALKSEPLRYGNRKFSKMYAQINNLRKAIRERDAEKTEAIWDQCEPFIDVVFEREKGRR